MSITTPAFQVGAVTYLNSKPLIEDLPELFPNSTLKLDYPSRLADALAAHQLDVALIPSIEYFRLAPKTPCRIVSDACVATHGPVHSVKLYSRVPWSKVRTLALDEGSRTSATLARILLHERLGLKPELTSFPLGSSIEETAADAVLMIGDRAMSPPRETFLDAWDLGEEWHRDTNLPFVFAMWVATGRLVESSHIKPDRILKPTDPDASEPFHLDHLAALLAEARDRGVARCEAVAAREAQHMRLTTEEIVRYFTENLFFTMGPDEKRGLQLYYQLATRLNLAPSGVQCEFCDPVHSR